MAELVGLAQANEGTAVCPIGAAVLAAGSIAEVREGRRDEAKALLGRARGYIHHPDLLHVLGTASAVLGDLVAVARNLLSGARGAGESSYAALRVMPMGEVITRYHISLDVADKPGVLAAVANTFSAHDVSIRTVRQEGHGGDATLVVVTHTATDAALQAVVAELRDLDVVRDVASVMRVEGQA